MINPSEAKTRKELIDPALKKADWDVRVTNPDNSSAVLAGGFMVSP